jgi:hypothetical protein
MMNACAGAIQRSYARWPSISAFRELGLQNRADHQTLNAEAVKALASDSVKAR